MVWCLSLAVVYSTSALGTNRTSILKRDLLDGLRPPSPAAAIFGRKTFWKDKMNSIRGILHSHCERPSDGSAVTGILRVAAMCALATALVFALAVTAGAQTYSVLYSFSGGADGGTPGPVNWDSSTGNLYGVTTDGGPAGYGTVFGLSPAGAESVLYSFTGPPEDGLGPNDVFRDAQGNLFGTTLSGGSYWGKGGGGTVFRIDLKGAEKVLHSFKGGADGDEPTSGLIQDPNTGDFYGVTVAGGTNAVGTLYDITGNGQETILYNFGQGGDQPAGTLVQDPTMGNLYGLLEFGGPWGCGGVFQFTPAGVETALYLFTGTRGDGCEPGPGDPGLVRDAQGNLFGTTFFGGNRNQGVVFELTAGGVEKVLYKFKGPKKGDGAWPLAGLALDQRTGNLYGTTEIGGTGQCDNGGHIPKGCGTIFELSPPATKHGHWRETVLYSFTGGADGGYPFAGLTRDTQTGNIYGTAVAGGTYGQGVVFELVP